MKIVNKRQYNEKTKVVDLQIDEIHNFAIGKSGTVVHNSHIRPRGTLIKGIGVGTPGVLAFMEIFDKTSDVITRGSIGETYQANGVHTKKGIRKGAMISLLSVRHPEIFDYIEAKKVPNRLTKFNMSVIITDEFMRALEQGGDWDLWFPDVHFEKYDDEWMGDFEDWDAKGYPKVIYKTIPAIDLWNHILKNMYNRNEPGLVFIDNANRNNNLLYKQKIVATNPCFTGDTMILTSEGSKRIDSLVGQTAKIYDGKQWVEVDNFRVTGENQDVYRVELNDGRHIDATAYHRFILEDGTVKELKDLQVGEKLKCIDLGTLEWKGVDTKAAYKCKPSGNAIKSIEFLRNEPKVYCCTVEKTHKVLLSNGILTGQCGEILCMSDPFEHNGIKAHGDICNLGHINLTAYLTKTAQQDFEFDFESFEKDAAILVEALDNIIDISAYPLPELKNAAILRRKIGCGVMGYASLLTMMGYRYNSKEAQEFTNKLLSIYANAVYQKSALLAKEKGKFPLCEIDKMMDNGFIKNSGVLTEETLDLIRKYGLRNSQSLTIAPTGNTSILMGLVSGGLEPVFEREYNRWVEQRTDYSALQGKSYPNLANGEWFDTKDFRKKLWGDEEVLESTWNDGQYVLHKSRGLIKRVACADFGYEWVKKNRTPEWIAEKEQQGVFVCAMDLSVKDHVDTLITFGKYVDNSISKTINLANDYPYEDFDGMFRQLWKDGVRGVTTYRAGTMSAVLEVKKPTQTVKQEQDDFFKEWESHNGQVVQESIKLPTEYPMHGYIVKSENKKWYFHAAFKDRARKKPFAVFVHTNSTEPNVTTYNALDLLEELAYTENVPEQHIERTKAMCKTQTNVAKLTRMVALLLRHNVKIIKIVQILESVECNVTSFIYAFKKFMMKFVPENTETGEKCPSCSGTILFTEGCVQCKDCGWQKC